MSIYKSSSLAMIPTAYKDGKLYSIRPTDGSGDFTFSRGSNLAATRVDVNGLIEKGRENLLLQSNSFSTSPWSNNDAGVTSGQADKDGGTNAWKWKVNSNASFHYTLQSHSILNSLCAYSIYAKANGYNFFRLEQGNNSQGAWFNLSSGTIGTTSANTIAKITSVGGGWYRCEISFVTAASSNFLMAFSASETLNYTGDNVSGGFIQDAQLEQGLVATDYIETTTTSVSAGILEDMPRLDYSGSCPSLLLEPQRSNLLENSEYILGGDWNALGGALTIEQNTSDTLSPEGKYNAGKITLSSTANRYFSSQGYNLGGLTNVSASVWLKSDGADIEGALAFFNGSGGDAITITNEWQRFTINKTASNSTEYVGLDFRGSGYSTSGVVYCYGWQLENNSSYPTSYIPTYGTSQTRSVDSCVATAVSDLIGQEQGTIFIDATLSNVLDSNIRGLIELNDGTTSNRFSIYRGGNTTNVTALVFKANAASASAISSSTGQTKIIIAYDEVSVRFYFNGVLIGTTTSASIPACNQIDLGIITNRADRVLGDVINQALVFPTALTDSECIALTSI